LWHYARKWTSKDVADLKKVIPLTSHGISSEVLTEQ